MYRLINRPWLRFLVASWPLVTIKLSFINKRKWHISNHPMPLKMKRHGGRGPKILSFAKLATCRIMLISRFFSDSIKTFYPQCLITITLFLSKKVQWLHCKSEGVAIIGFSLLGLAMMTMTMTITLTFWIYLQ
jgi:hypothetical protein